MLLRHPVCKEMYNIVHKKKYMLAIYLESKEEMYIRKIYIYYLLRIKRGNVHKMYIKNICKLFTWNQKRKCHWLLLLVGMVGNVSFNHWWILFTGGVILDMTGPIPTKC